MSTISPPAGPSVDLTLPTPTPAPDVAAAPVAAEAVRVGASARWSVATRLAFRMSVVYFSLYVICTQMLWALLPIPVNIGQRQVGLIPPVRWITESVAVKLLGVTPPVSMAQSGSGDKIVDWAQAIGLLLVAVVATVLWSLLARSRTSHPGVQKWFRLFLRFAVATTMMSYGMVKVFPLQMPAPGLTRLLEPFGNFSPMGVLWASIGASKSYEMFAGACEVLAAILLFIPGLTRLGALVCFAVVTQIFVLNMTYDVPVKLFSFHLLVMCVVLLAPDCKRLVNFLILDRAVEPSNERPLVSNRRGRAILIAAQIVFATYVVGVNGYQAADRSKTRGPDAPKPALFGIWDIERMTINGVERAPLVTDYDRWRRLLIGMGNSVSFQRMDSTFVNLNGTIDMTAKKMELNRGANFTFQQPAPDRLILEGDAEGRAVRLETRRVDHTKFQLLSRGFNWVQEVPFNR